jgi:hypothetical protein
VPRSKDSGRDADISGPIRACGYFRVDAQVWVGILAVIFNIGIFPRPLPEFFLRRPIGVAFDMLPILFPARGFDPST